MPLKKIPEMPASLLDFDAERSYIVLRHSGAVAHKPWPVDREHPWPSTFTPCYHLLVSKTLRDEQGAYGNFNILLVEDEGPDPGPLNKFLNGHGDLYIVAEFDLSFNKKLPDDAIVRVGQMYAPPFPRWACSHESEFGFEIPIDLWVPLCRELAFLRHVMRNPLTDCFVKAVDWAVVKAKAVMPPNQVLRMAARLEELFVSGEHPHMEILTSAGSKWSVNRSICCMPVMALRSREALYHVCHRLREVMVDAWPPMTLIPSVFMLPFFADLAPFHFDDPRVSLGMDAACMAEPLMAFVPEHKMLAYTNRFEPVLPSVHGVALAPYFDKFGEDARESGAWDKARATLLSAAKAEGMTEPAVPTASNFESVAEPAAYLSSQSSSGSSFGANLRKGLAKKKKKKKEKQQAKAKAAQEPVPGPDDGVWIEGTEGHFPDTDKWYRSAGGARRGDVDAACYVCHCTNGKQYEVWVAKDQDPQAQVAADGSVDSMLALRQSIEAHPPPTAAGERISKATLKAAHRHVTRNIGDYPEAMTQAVLELCAANPMAKEMMDQPCAFVNLPQENRDALSEVFGTARPAHVRDRIATCSDDDPFLYENTIRLFTAIYVFEKWTGVWRFKLEMRRRRRTPVAIVIQRYQRGHSVRAVYSKELKRRAAQRRHDQLEWEAGEPERERERLRHAAAERSRADARLSAMSKTTRADLTARPQHCKKRVDRTAVQPNANKEREHADFISPQHRAARKETNKNHNLELKMAAEVRKEAKARARLEAIAEDAPPPSSGVSLANAQAWHLPKDETFRRKNGDDASVVSVATSSLPLPAPCPHAVERGAEKNVDRRWLQDALKNGDAEEQPGGRVKHYGKDAVIVTNTDATVTITTWPTKKQ